MSGYGYPGSGDGGWYSYPASSGGYGYPSAPQTDDGSNQPQNLVWEMSKRGKIGRGSGGYWNRANWGWRVLAALIDYGPLFLKFVNESLSDPLKHGGEDLLGSTWLACWSSVGKAVVAQPVDGK